ncbi:MAG: hypothetical protein H0X24_03675 [Ktedonobacterales bacterium]|nr:hypothetical protein [Ktedonobacterales bacterium]
MFALLRSKIAIAIIGCIAVGTITATAAVANAAHAGPFGLNTSQHSLQGGNGDHTATPGDHAQEVRLQGAIQSVTFAAGSITAGSFVVLPQEQQQTVTVQFTNQTHIEVSSNDEKSDVTSTKGSDDGKATPVPDHGQPHGAALTAGLFVQIEGTKQRDGSVLAKEIQANDNGNAHQGVDGTPEPGEIHGTPEPGDSHGTPEPGDSHGTPQPSH